VGLIGSKTKRARFLSRLRADGLGEAAAARLVCPIGLAQIRSKAPEAIAVSVAADLLIRLEAARLARPTEASVAGL
jgi:xanthine dehydrogenase accessory factor